VAELLVPELADLDFREHYRTLILGAVRRSAEAQRELYRARGQHRRARKADHVVALLGGAKLVTRPELEISLEPVPEPPPIPLRKQPLMPAVAPPAPVTAVAAADRWVGPRLRSAARILWFVTAAVLICDVAVLGIESWTTTAADLGLIVVTVVWFVVRVDDLIGPAEPPPEQLELF
jgi:hypothetical protein